MENEKLKILTDLVEKNRGKKPEEIIPELVSASIRLKQMGLEFSNDETEEIIESLKENMTYDEKKRLEIIKEVFKKR